MKLLNLLPNVKIIVLSLIAIFGKIKLLHSILSFLVNYGNTCICLVHTECTCAKKNLMLTCGVKRIKSMSNLLLGL